MSEFVCDLGRDKRLKDRDDSDNQSAREDGLDEFDITQMWCERWYPVELDKLEAEIGELVREEASISREDVVSDEISYDDTDDGYRDRSWDGFDHAFPDQQEDESDDKNHQTGNIGGWEMADWFEYVGESVWMFGESGES